jgi:hypothetical protein
MFADCFSVSEAKFERLRFVENIFVVNAAPNVDPPLSDIDAASPGDATNRNWSPKGKSETWSNRQLAGFSVRHGEGQCFSVKDLEVRLDAVSDIEGRGLPCIPNSDFDYEGAAPILAHYFTRFDTDISPQLLLRTFFQMIELTFTSVEQFVSAALQGEGVSSNEGSRYSSYERAKYVETYSDFAEGESNYVIAGALFCAFLGCFAYLIMQGSI